MTNVLVVENLSVKYGSFTAVDSVNLTLKPGVYGLIGPNGAGKTSLIRAITTLINPSSGEILYNGDSVNNQIKSFRNSIGLLPQSIQGYGDFKALRFLYYMAGLKGYTKKDAAKEIDALVKIVGLEDHLNKKIKEYSGGMKQRLMFVQALMGNPQILILDEPTAGLDPMERIKMRNYISMVAREKIVILATHVMQDIEAISENIIFIKKGKIVYNGSSQELLESLKGHVVSSTVDRERLEFIQEEYLISNMVRHGKHYTLRYLKKGDSEKESNVTPTLEDAYLYYLGES